MSLLRNFFLWLIKCLLHFTSVFKGFVWSQEEHQNMGAWSFVQTRFRNLLGCNVSTNTKRIIIKLIKHYLTNCITQ